MNWRALGTILFGILLPLPLLWLLASTSWISGARSSVPRRAVLPMLSPSERQSALTYGRECHTDEECDPRLRCFFSMVTQDSYCVDSRCMVDAHCPDGFSCQTYTSESGRDLIRACSLLGDRKEGEICAGFTRDRHYGCEAGLVCNYRCGRPCQLDAPPGCPDGFFCADVPAGPVCQPTCQGRTCPEGQQCVSVGPNISICARVHGQNCQQTPCAPERTCIVNDYPLSPGEVWMSCSQSCGSSDEPLCPEGSVCDVYHCRRKCPAGSDAFCGPGYRCKQRSGDLWLCESDHRDKSDE